MSRTLSKQLVISQADGSLPHKYDILEDADRELQWFEGSDSEDAVRAGQPVIHKWNFFGGGACETVDMGRGGYFFSTNCTVCNPFRIRPRPETTSVTLTGNTVPIERFFEATDGTNKYLYCLAGAKSFKIKDIAGTPALAETKTFTVTSYFAQGVYTGDGNATKAITGAGFQPCAVIIKGEGTTDTIIRTTDMPANTSKSFDATASSTQGIRTLDADGFTVGNDATVNTNGVKYYWQAWKAGAGRIATGTYNGDDSDNRDIAALGFKPKIVHITKLSGAGIMTRSDSIDSDTDDTYFLTDGAMSKPPLEDRIQALNNDGFQVGTSTTVNGNAIAYYWLAIGAVTGQVATGSYAGGAGSELAITGVGFTPKYVHIRGRPLEYAFYTYLHGIQRNASLAGDKSEYFDTHAEGTDLIKSLDSDGFTVGNDIEVGRVDYLYHWCAFGGGDGTPQVGKPAKWPISWCVPLGAATDAQRLSTVHNEGGAGDDTWIDLIGLSAKHFERRGNKLARATKRHVSLCSADDIANLANWGPNYPVGPPDTVITDLVEWKAELAVCTTDGMYMFDGVATSKQQLPLMGGIKDDDNGKNTLNWMGQVLVPTKGGLLRWSYGAAKPVGPDSIFGYVEAEGVSNEPIHLQHFGLTFLEDWIYEAVYDGTNYHIIYYRPLGEGFRPDFLLTSSSVIKTVFVDSNARLWFGLGNNLSSIQLRRSGAPTGGNYGEASLTGSFYTSEKVLADGANVRCRMAKVETDNNQTTLTWKLYSIRDGATAEQVGAAAGFKTDGEQKLYWTAASNLLARRLRYRLDFACSSFSPETTPPECLSLEFRGDALPDDADVIRVVVSLDSEGRANKTVYDELAAHENAGVRRVRTPITDQTLNVTIFHRELTWVKQRGTEPPKVGVMLYMRRGDVA